MTETRTMRVRTPTDLLALVPYIFGFHPKDSLVMVAAKAKQPVNVRVDLPTDLRGINDLAVHLSRVSQWHGVSVVMLAFYTEDLVLADSAHEAMRACLHETGVSVAAAIRADGSRWWSLAGRTSGCSPDDGTPYDIGSHEFTAQGVLDGKVTLASRRELADSLVTSDPADVEEVQGAADEALRPFHSVSSSSSEATARASARAHLVREGRWVEQRVDRYLEDGLRLDVQDAGRLLVGIAFIEVRDVAWAQMRHGNAVQHVDLWRDLVRRSPRDLLAAPAALLGFAAWLSGDGALAWCAVDRCQEAEPDYSLALLLTDALAGAVPPSSWQPVDREMLTLFTG